MQYDFKKQLRSFGYAWQGIRSCVGKEQNLSFHLIAMTAVTCGICFRHYAHGMDGRYPLFRCGDCRRAVQHRYRKAGGPGISRTASRCGAGKRHCRRSSAGVRCCGGNYRIDNLYTVSLKADVILPFSFYSRDTSAGRRRTRQVWRLHRRRGKAGTHLPGGKPLPDPPEVRFP
mgnify:FL=1